MATRRAVLGLTASLVGLGLAGCSEDGSGDGDEEPRGFVQVYEERDVEWDARLTASEFSGSVEFHLVDFGSFDRLYVQVAGEPVEGGEFESAGDRVVVDREQYVVDGTERPIEIVGVKGDFHGVVLEYHDRFVE